MGAQRSKVRVRETVERGNEREKGRESERRRRVPLICSLLNQKCHVDSGSGRNVYVCVYVCSVQCAVSLCVCTAQSKCKCKNCLLFVFPQRLSSSFFSVSRCPDSEGGGCVCGRGGFLASLVIYRLRSIAKQLALCQRSVTLTRCAHGELTHTLHPFCTYSFFFRALFSSRSFSPSSSHIHHHTPISSCLRPIP